jgi:hypothetical protein
MEDLARRVARRFTKVGTQQRRLDELQNTRNALGPGVPKSVDEQIQNTRVLLKHLADNPNHEAVLDKVASEMLDKLAASLEVERKQLALDWRSNALPEAAKAIRRAFPELSYWTKGTKHRFYWGSEPDDYFFLELGKTGVRAFKPQRSRALRLTWLDKANKVLERMDSLPEVLQQSVR